MVLLNSENSRLGQKAPYFSLESIFDENVSLAQFQDAPATVIMFICNHCPYVQAVEDRYIQLARDCEELSVPVIGICSNDPTDYPDDSKEALRKRWKEKGYNFPYLIDETQQVAKDYGVVCTPEFFILDSNQSIAYHGQLDNNWKEPSKVKRRDLWECLNALLKSQKLPFEPKPSMGCSIKWKKDSSSE